MSWPSGVQQLTTLTGAEQINVANGSELALQANVALISSFGNVNLVTNGATVTGTLTTAQIGGSGLSPPGDVIEFCNGSTSGNITLTTPTVAQMVAAFPNWTVGSSYLLAIVNAGTGNNVVLGAGTGWTITGTATVSNNTWRKFVLTLTSATVITATMVEVGTYS